MIICLSGRKSSGKNTLANYAAGLILKNQGIITSNFAITEEGWLWVKEVCNNPNTEGILDLNNPNSQVQKFLIEEVYPFVKLYSFADELKTFCINVLGLTHNQCYGLDADKNSLTNIRWEDCAGSNKQGIMTAREVLQYFGTNMCRKMVPNCWAEATMKKIARENSMCAIITDCRFPDEVESVQNAGGTVIRLVRDIYNDQHESEVALDIENYDWTKFDFIFDNSNLGIVNSCLEFQHILKEIGLITE